MPDLLYAPPKQNNQSEFISLKIQGFENWSSYKPVYKPVKSITVKLVCSSTEEPLPSRCVEEIESTHQEQNESLPLDATNDSEETVYNRQCENVRSNKNMKKHSFAWMWEDFSVDHYSPNLATSTNDLMERLVKIECPRMTVCQPFQMTSQDEKGQIQQKIKKPSKGEELGEPAQTPPFLSNSFKPGLPLNDQLMKECKKQREILHEEQTVTMQKTFSFIVGKCSSERSRREVSAGGLEELQKDIPKNMVQRPSPATKQPSDVRAEEKPLFKPRINRTVPDFGKLHHIFENHLRKVRQKRQPTVPQPFSFQNDNSPQCRTPKDPPHEPKHSGGQIPKWDAQKLMARSQKLTKSALLRAMTTRRRMVQKERTLWTKQGSDARQRLQKEVTRWISARERQTQSRMQKQQDFRRAVGVRSAEYKAELCKIMERVRKRPLLLEHYPQTNVKHSVAGRFSVLLEQAGLDEALRWRQALLEEMRRRLCTGQFRRQKPSG